jgi:gamma-glutamyltranspeptidase/glutathione hydrolase
MAIPGDGFLPAGVPAVPASLVLTLDRFGTLSFAEIAKDAIRLAEEGFPVDQRWRDSLVGKSGPHSLRGFLEQWPTSAKLFLNDGALPELGEVTRNPELGQMLRRLVDAERRALAAGASRKVALRAVHEYFYKGPIAREIVDFTREFRVKDAEGGFHHGLLALEDFAKFEARVEEPWTLTYRGYQVHKCGPWTQGPVFLQQLALLEGYDLKGLGHNSVDYLHLWFETAKLAHADKEKYYGDPDFVYVPKQGLLSKKYAAVRRKLIDLDRASTELRPGDPFPFDEHPDRRPTVLKLGRGLRDHGTTGIRSVDSKGNMFTATASGGWFYDSPIVPGLGIALGTRIQMFYLDKGLAKSLAPGKQPSTSLTPTLVLRDGQPFMAFGMPGGDWQDQGTLQFFLNVVDFGMGVQEALDAPKVWTDHFPSLFYPHRSTPGHAGLEKYFPDLQKIVSGLSQKGHKVDVRAVPLPSNWHGADNTMVVVRDPRTGTFLAATNPRMPFSTALAW